MSDIRIKMRELHSSRAPGMFGERLHVEAPLAARAPASPLVSQPTTSRSWWARGLRVVRNAALAVAVLALVPIGLVTLQGETFARATFYGNTTSGSLAARLERAQPLRLPVDPSITPMQAGLALNALQPHQRKAAGFEAIEPATRPTATWQTRTIAPGMFPSAQPISYNVTSSRTVLEASVKGFSPREMEYLHALATAPVWREFDLVARAPAVDVVGGQFRIPFGADAFPEARPVPSFRDLLELTEAAVSRAAYHVALGQRDSAETVLRSIVSFGLALVNNSSSGPEVYLGGIIVDKGRDALRRFYVIQHDPRAGLPAFAPLVRARVDYQALAKAQASMSGDVVRRRLLARIEDPATLLRDRLGAVRGLAGASCTNVRELLLGPSAEVNRALASARYTVARYPSERALVDLDARLLVPEPIPSWMNPIQSLAVSSATVAGVVLHNPRLAACTRILSSGGY